MYYSHFGLSGPPFQITSSPNVLYWGMEHLKAFAALEWGLVHEQSGFTVLVGEVGTGKTTVALAILARKYQNVRTTYVTNSKLNFDEILKGIMGQLGIKVQGRTRLAQLGAFDQFLRELPAGERVAVVLDEAQGLSDETLEQIRLLSNSGRAEEKQLHFLLIGQTELARRLNRPALRQLDQRVGARAVLNPLRRAEAHAYVEERLRATGGSAAQIFTPGALRYILRHSRRIPRRINVLCHNAMLMAFGSGAKRVDARMARGAVSEYGNLFATLRAAAKPNGFGGSIRRAVSYGLESVALVLLSASRKVTPEPSADLTSGGLAKRRKPRGEAVRDAASAAGADSSFA
jgi:general secretion pathway protein A